MQCVREMKARTGSERQVRQVDELYHLKKMSRLAQRALLSKAHLLEVEDDEIWPVQPKEETSKQVATRLSLQKARVLSVGVPGEDGQPQRRNVAVGLGRCLHSLRLQRKRVGKA